MNHSYKTPHYPLEVRTHSIRWPSLHDKEIKLFFPNSPETVSSRFNSEAGFGISPFLPHNLHPLNSLLFKGGEGITLWICLLSVLLCLSNTNIRQLQASLCALQRPALSPSVLPPYFALWCGEHCLSTSTLRLSCPALCRRALTFTGH